MRRLPRDAETESFAFKPRLPHPRSPFPQRTITGELTGPPEERRTNHKEFAMNIKRKTIISFLFSS